MMNLQSVLSWTSLEIPQVPAWLPVGISFFTFQAQSYTIDVYYKVIPAEKSLLRFSLFVSFFPQLVAGPIVKARHFLPQLQRIPKVQWEDVSFALFSISTGLMLKMVVADNLAQYTIALKAPLYEVRHSLNLLVLSWAFMVQIFGDFAGYSAIAIGLARLFGYRLPINFNAPFIALGFNDFWKRWHITLTNWFKDYLFLRMAMRGPLKGKMYHGLGLTFLASGLWHGAHWTYVIWGALQGLGCIVDMAYHRSHGPRWAPSGWRAFLIWALTFQCICWLGVVFFHHEMDPVLGYFSFLFGEGWQQPLLLPRVADMIFFMMPVLVIHLYVLLEERTRKQKKCSFLLDLREKSSFQMVMTGLNLCLLSLMWGEKQGFIYFAF
jgi:D-alanyl-lipoteichoic acid acyltransferase DltB (MBOAT superfamily)